MQTIPQSDIDRVKAEHPEWELIKFTDNETEEVYVFRVPGSPEYNEFLTSRMDDALRPRAMRTLTQRCAVIPAGPEWAAVLVKAPGLSESFGDKLLQAAALNRSVTVEKL